MVVHRKQTVASGEKNDDNVESVDAMFTGEVSPKKTPKKRVYKKGDRKATDPIKAFASKTALQSQLEKEQGFDDIIKSHLQQLENLEMCKGIRVEKIAFAVFLALPENIRGNQQFFSKTWGISEQTLSGWKMDKDIQKIRMKVMKAVLLDKTPAVLDNLFMGASTRGINGVNTPAIKLWLQYIEEWEEASKMSIAADGFTINFHAGQSQFIQPEDESEDAPRK